GSYISPLATFWDEQEKARQRTSDEAVRSANTSALYQLSPPQQESGPSSDIRPGESSDFVQNHPVFTNIIGGVFYEKNTKINVNGYVHCDWHIN
ncbi:MAG: hypothetical protein Q8934_20380, partial [Bacillota bacterium]|nr:hypothetical protein [Bacillota bacterium]